MSKFEDQLSRMKSLYTYGTVNEDAKRQSNYTLVSHTVAADGKSYGIVKECSHFYIKYTTPNNQNIAESYQYIGGINNKKKYQFESLNAAEKFFEGKLSSINEAFDGHVNTESLDPYKKNIVLAEATDKMRNEIARQRQIMFNASMLMNESETIDAGRKGDARLYTGANPEAETGKKGDKMEGSKDAKVVDQDKVKRANGVIKDGEMPDVKTVKEGCCKCGCVDGSCKCNEEDDEKFSNGLPSSEGTGEADNSHNNDPFNKPVNEGVDDEDDVDFSDELDVDDDVENEDELDIDDDEFDTELDAEDDDELDLSDMDDEDDFDDEFSDDVDDIETDKENEDEDGEQSIADLMARIAELEAKVSELEGDGAQSDMLPDEDGVEDEDDMVDDVNDAEVDSELDSDEEDADMTDDFAEEDGMDECGFGSQMESKRAFMNRIVESVVNSYKKGLNEDKLHDFGKHPGYRKKPMTLPTTGEDKNTHGKDWNDESCHSEEPFGKQIGNGDPFNNIVNAVTEDVMHQLKHVISSKNEKKKE